MLASILSLLRLPIPPSGQAKAGKESQPAGNVNTGFCRTAGAGAFFKKVAKIAEKLSGVRFLCVLGVKSPALPQILGRINHKDAEAPRKA